MRSKESLSFSTVTLTLTLTPTMPVYTVFELKRNSKVQL